MKVGRKFKTKLPTMRKNSEMIRRLFYDLIAQEFDRSIDQACDAFNAKLQALDDKRDYDTNIQPGSLQKIILDHHFISYAHLNALAKFYDIPISVMLLFTRVRDELESPETRSFGRASNIITAFRAAIDHLEAVTEETASSDGDVFAFLGHAGFRQYVEAYRSNFEALWTQPRLPEF
jgi:hypothetical protein